MRDIFVERARAAFTTLLAHFASSLLDHFPECAAATEWKLASDATTTTPADVDVQIDQWCVASDMPLVKGCAKYAKAVTSILGKPASVAHAIAYHDIEAIAASATYFAHLRPKLAKLSAVDTVVFWQYVHDLTSTAFTCVRREQPRVPTTLEISADIANRRGKLILPALGTSRAATTSTFNPAAAAAGTPPSHGSSTTQGRGAAAGAGGGGGGMHKAVLDVWRKLHALRGVELDAAATSAHENDDHHSLTQRLHHLSLETIDGRTVAALSELKDPACFAHVCRSYPSLDVSVPLTDEQWTLFTHALSMSTMCSNIPTLMMRGIEDVAMEIANDIYEGKTTLHDLDVTTITQRVLASLSIEDIEAFKHKIPDIVPSILPVLRGTL